MNLVSFVDELVKVGAMDCLYKRADDSEVTTEDVPHMMLSNDPMPPTDRLHPAEAATRLPLTAGGIASIVPGTLGPVAGARNPIDRERFNRVYRDRR